MDSESSAGAGSGTLGESGCVGGADWTGDGASGSCARTGTAVAAATIQQRAKPSVVTRRIADVAGFEVACPPASRYVAGLRMNLMFSNCKLDIHTSISPKLTLVNL